MTTRSAFLSGAVKLGTGQAVSQLCSFVRSVILARLISPENFGIAATFAMTFALLEMVSNISAQTLLVQAADGNDEDFQATGHLLLVVRGVLNATMLLLLAAPLSSLFDVPQARWAFYWLAVIPLARGLGHLDASRFQRDLHFTPQIVVDIASNILVTLVAWPLAVWLVDYSAMLWLILLQVIVGTIGSHLVAKRRYTWSWHREYVKRFFSFGWPLLVNGLLMYGIFQGDRFVIGASRRLFPHSTYTLTDLGVYSVAFAVAMTPNQFCAGVASSLFLPLLSRAQTRRDEFTKRYIACGHLVSYMGLVVAIPLIIAGGWIVPMVYGPNYASAGNLIGWLSAMWAMRTFRMGPTLAAMALGDTRNAMISNIARTLALVGMLIVAAAGKPLVLVAVCGFVGEVLATAVCVMRLSAKHDLPPALSLRPFCVYGAGMCTAALAHAGAAGPIVAISIAVLLLCLCAAAMLSCFPELRAELRALLNGSRLAVSP